MGNAVLLTGATGFLGSAIAEELMRATSKDVFVLVRPRQGRDARQRLESLWCERPTLCGALGTRIHVVEGDVGRDGLGLTRQRYDELADEVGVVIHAAAEVGVNQTAERFWETNVRGTHRVLEFARRAASRNGLDRFVHISTAYVAGQLRGHIPERLFGDDRYNSLYERSKHQAELLVSTYADEFPCTVVRPAQIVGDSRTGFVATFNTLYYPLKRYLAGGLRVLPAPPDLRVNMVPVDYVAHLACRAALVTPAGAVHADAAGADPAQGGSPQGVHVVHAVGRPEELPTIGELVDAVRSWAREHLDLGLPTPRYLPVPGIAAVGRVRNVGMGGRQRRKGPLRNLVALAPYFYESRSFAVENARALAARPFPDWHDYLPNLLAYATRRGFLDYTDRTVYEQMLVRLRPGASTRMRFFDVTADGIERHEGTEVRKEILRVAHALSAAGVTASARVATLGVNSMRYAILDAAIGLVGGTNVPIYYTSSVQDVRELVGACGASLLFLGTDRMLDELELTGIGARVICLTDRVALREGIECWESFLSEGAREAGSAPTAVGEAPLPYVSPGQTATIRYTSGTTGTPKGVTFSQQQVRWMGEVMPAILDWRTRTSRTVRYLSFLPMSHVVEGILVAYAPYYILSDIEMYYLNDFPALAKTLPKVRPSLFFSVPRFYEKVWNQFAASGAGRLWTGLPDGMAKRLLSIPLRHAILRRAGLDRCRQLIVGSAPIGTDLLESYRSLGIEIHNAFGVTEAPLVTLSRLGHNELGSVGQLLPQTELRLDGEGLVYVRGPQVTRRYDGMAEPAVDEDGWFCTGDLGRWSPEGNLVLEGRKKEILVTSYGKNLAPQKIEVLLKGIDGVSEAMVVADGKPFATALLWLEDDASDADFAALDADVREANERLSHPEQVKRWAVCARPLTVAAAELTPNLKVRRDAVARSRDGVIRELYEGWDTRGAADVLHWGEER